MLPYINAAKIPKNSIYAKETGKRIFPVHEILNNRIVVLLIGCPVRHVDFGIREVKLLEDHHDGSFSTIKIQ